MTALTDANRRRLEQLLGMTGSAHDGEAINALRLAQRLVANAGITLLEALSVPPNTTALDLQRIASVEADAYARGFRRGLEEGGGAVQDRPRTWPLFAQHLLDHHARLLNSWEQSFCNSFCASGWPEPTVKQRAIFTKIANRCGERLPS
jgi:hypothetical protein